MKEKDLKETIGKKLEEAYLAKPIWFSVSKAET